MKSTAENPDAYIRELPEDRQEAMSRLRTVILENLPEGYAETMQYGMITYVIPHSIYPAGYHTEPRQALPCFSIASQKGYIAFYHMGIYAAPSLLTWFLEEYAKVSPAPPDMGKGCIRFRKPDNIPYEALGKLVARVQVKEWIATYEASIRNAKKK